MLPFHLQHTRDAALRGPGEHWGWPHCASPSAQWRRVAVVFGVCTSSGPVWHCLPSLQYLNIKLTDISIPDPDKYPHMVRASATCCWMHPCTTYSPMWPDNYNPSLVLHSQTRPLPPPTFFGDVISRRK